MPAPLSPSSQSIPQATESPPPEDSMTFTWLEEAIDDAEDLEVLADALIQGDISHGKEQPLDYEMVVHSTDANTPGQAAMLYPACLPHVLRLHAQPLHQDLSCLSNGDHSELAVLA